MTLQISSEQPTIRSSQTPLPQNNYTTVHTWSINNFSVNLIQNNQNLMFEVIESTKKELLSQGPIEITPSITIGRMISRLKSCEVIIKEDNNPRFLPIFHKWSINNQNISLIKGNEDLIWKIFNTATNKVSFFNLAEQTTIPSKRCHPDTVALIERIKKDYSNGNNLKILIEDFHAVNVLDIDTCRKEHEELEKIINKIESDYKLNIEKSEDIEALAIAIPGIASPIVGFYKCYKSWSTVVNLAKGASVFAGGGVAGNAAGGLAGYLVAAGYVVGYTTAGVVGPALVVAGAKGIHDLYKKNKKDKQKNPLEIEQDKAKIRLNKFSVQRPLFVEIEPISVASLIDPRIRVSKFTWAITLVVAGGCTKGKTNIKTHAELLIEGIYDGHFKVNQNEKLAKYQKKTAVQVNEYFMNLVHLTYEGIESLPLENPNSFVKSIKERSEIWMKPANEINRMFDYIQKQKDEETPTNKKFSVLGKESVFSNEHNCITFCLENLKLLNIYLPRNLGDKIVDKLIFTDPIRYTKDLNYYKDEIITVQI